MVKVNIFGGQQEASRITGISQGNISSVCMGLRNTAGNFIWRFANV